VKIVSKFTDYYDYCVSIFGRDQTRVYDRRIQNSLLSKEGKVLGTCVPKIYTTNPGVERYTFHLAGKKKLVCEYKGKFYFDKKSFDRECPNRFYHTYYFGWDTPTSLNEKYRTPVIVEDSWGGLNIPILREFHFIEWMPAEEIYQLVYNYLGWLKDNPAIPNNQTDKEKVTSHGFDKITSFRKMTRQ
jgi:hypothetical protein